MSTPRLAAFEFRRFKGALPKIALVFLVLVPLMYGALYLWSNWDPYGRLDQVPVAVVNQDQPVKANGATVDAGGRFVEQLKADPIFQWHFTDAEDAADGLAHGRYYLTITVPEDFSADLASASGDDPRRAVLQMHRDDVNGYVIGIMTSTVQDKLTTAINQAAEQSYFSAIFADLDDIHDQISSAADGAGKLATGLDDAKAGADKLAAGLASAKTGSAQLESGLTSAKKGSADLASGLSDADTGAGTLADGLKTAKTGSADLATGIDTLKDGSAALAPGADDVAAGNKELAGAVVPVLDAVVPILPKVTAANADITAAVSDVADLTAGDSDSLADRTAAVDTALAALAKDHPDLAADPNFTALQDAAGKVGDRAAEISTAVGTVSDAAGRVSDVATTINDNVPQIGDEITGASARLTRLADGSQRVADGAHRLDDGLGTAQSGAHTLADGISDASTGADSLESGLDTLTTGAKDLDAGLGKLQTGSSDLAKGISSAATGAKDLDTGLGKLDTGARELADQLTAGAKRIPVLSKSETDDAVAVLSSPTDVQMTVDNPAGVYGRGLAPFFFAIAIWVFGISVFLVVRPISARALAGRARAARIAVAGWLPVAALGTLGALILLAVAWFALGLDPLHAVASTGVVVLAAICFTAIAHLLRTAFGTVGSAVTLVLLMVQLTSAGGLYPVETLPLPFRAIHPVIPMTYLIDALRIGFTGGPMDRLWVDVAVLAGGAALAVGLCIGVVSRRKRFAFTDLHPQLA